MGMTEQQTESQPSNRLPHTSVVVATTARRIAIIPKPRVKRVTSRIVRLRNAATALERTGTLSSPKLFTELVAGGIPTTNQANRSPKQCYTHVFYRFHTMVASIRNADALSMRPVPSILYTTGNPHLLAQSGAGRSHRTRRTYFGRVILQLGSQLGRNRLVRGRCLGRRSLRGGLARPLRIFPRSRRLGIRLLVVLQGMLLGVRLLRGLFVLRRL